MTPAIRRLEQLGIEFELREYELPAEGESYGLDAARALGVDPIHVWKTLVAELDTGELVVGIVPVAATLDLKMLAAAAGARRAAMATVAAAERSSGYVTGGISPVGQRKALRTFIDAAVTVLDRVHVSAGRRGLQLYLTPTDLIAATSALVAPIART